METGVGWGGGRGEWERAACQGFLADFTSGAHVPVSKESDREREAWVCRDQGKGWVE